MLVFIRAFLYPWFGDAVIGNSGTTRGHWLHSRLGCCHLTTSWHCLWLPGTIILLLASSIICQR